MAKYYKLWVEIEEINEEEDHYEDYGEPMSLCTTWDSPDAAVEYQKQIIGLIAHLDGVLCSLVTQQVIKKQGGK